jgi:uncharacterized heparinase superfamily protein
VEFVLAQIGKSDFPSVFRFSTARLALRLAASAFATVRWIKPTPFSGRIERILIAPQDLRTSDPTAASDIYSGYFAFAGKIVTTGGQSPFLAQPPSRAWTEALMGFGWLRDIRAADTALARANARTLVGDWISKLGSPSQSITWAIPVTSQRLIAWLCHSPLIVDGSDRSFYRRFMASIRRQSAYLWRRSRRIDNQDHRLRAAIALVFVALCTDMSAGRRKRVIDYLVSQLGKEILSDGGHVSRNPQIIVNILAELLPLRHCFLSQGLTPPAELLNAIDRMMPMVRLFRHGDGTLALFNGMSATAPDLIATLLAYQDARSGVTETAGPSGYRRLQADKTVIILDVGKKPPIWFSNLAHAGCLSFEFSDGGEKLITNCGAPTAGQEGRRPLARATAAHSTLTVGDRSSGRFFPFNESRYPYGEPMIDGPRSVDVFRDVELDGERVTAVHDGYAESTGLYHKRSLWLERNGKWLSGEDELIISEKGKKGVDLPFYIRFHLHPNVNIIANTSNRATLMLPSWQLWTFSANHVIGIDDSVIFASLDGTRRTRQLLIECRTVEKSTIKWLFSRDDGSSLAQEVMHISA